MERRAEPEVGRRLRHLRQRRGLSQRALARLCDLSANAIGLIERGECSPSVASLHRLAMALDVPITDLFTEKEDLLVILTKKGHRPQEQRKLVVMEALAEGLAGQGIEPFLVTLEPGAGAGADPVVHMGEEFIFCLEGELEYRIAGQVYRLKEGDSLIFLAHQPHSWRNPGEQPVKFLLLFQETEKTQRWWQQHLKQ